MTDHFDVLIAAIGSPRSDPAAHTLLARLKAIELAVQAITPSGRPVAISGDDDNDLEYGTCRALLVGTAGAASIIDEYGYTVLALPLQAGYNPISIKRLLLTGLTADNIFALY